MLRSVAAAALAVGLALMAGPLRSAELTDEFNGAPVNERLWDPCEADPTTPPSFVRLGKRHVIAMTVNKDTWGKDGCFDGKTAFLALQKLGITLPYPDIQDGSDLGESLVPSQTADVDPAKCPKGVPPDQRNELRPQQRGRGLTHSFLAPYWYSITFQTQGDIPTCGSGRWVLAQWKQSGLKSPRSPSAMTMVCCM